ncbi:MAG: Phosphoheptose isomerase [Chlamydiia bacterium]|nr:Phosphoheptose isomerase [Chlamydiia bacterium]MCH9616410.1 Phosphoheptose isomerase [Chlamydiia bacterium]MCH9629604.1 Phosphoheptose isomerase [Chlamydiia bacterium]
MLDHTKTYINSAVKILENLDSDLIDELAEELALLRERSGRLFLLGVGGSAANCSHAVNDFRKLCNIEAYAPTDNVSELTARTNDEGWETVFSSYLNVSRANEKDAIFVFSVGGGDEVNNVSPNIVLAVDEAKKRGMKVFGIVGRNGGYTKKFGDTVIVVPTVDPTLITPLSESFQTVIWHGLVSHPKLSCNVAKWEGLLDKVKG